MTYPEVLLWQRLRGSSSGLKFRRQHPAGPDYTIDFYCAAAKLAIEVDGQIHAYSAAADATKDRYLVERGLRVIRIPAADVLRDADATAAAIVAFAAAPLHHSPAASGPPPRSGEDRP